MTPSMRGTGRGRVPARPVPGRGAALAAADVAGRGRGGGPLRHAADRVRHELYWGWDGAVTDEVIARDLDTFKRARRGHGDSRARYGMPTPYLSPGWFERVRVAVQQARQRGMHVWLVDEGKYPSGFAGRQVQPRAARPADAGARGLRAREARRAARRWSAASVPRRWARWPWTSRRSPSRCSDGERHAALDGSASGPLRGARRAAPVPHGGHARRQRPQRAKTDKNSLCDYLDPAATRQFLEFTHAQYEKSVGAEFGATVLGFRGDEPDYAYVPWTPALLARVRGAQGLRCAALYWPPSSRRADARASGGRRPTTGTSGPISSATTSSRVQADWCAAQGSSISSTSTTKTRCRRWCARRATSSRPCATCKCPASMRSGTRSGRARSPISRSTPPRPPTCSAGPRAFTESFAAYRTAPDVEQARWVLNHQLVARHQHGRGDVRAGASRRRPERSTRAGWQPAVSPAWPPYVNRASYLLSQGRPAATDRRSTTRPAACGSATRRRTRARSTWRGGCWSSSATSTSWTSRRCRRCSALDGAAFVNASGQRYEAVILPRTTAISTGRPRSPARVREGRRTGDRPGTGPVARRREDVPARPAGAGAAASRCVEASGELSDRVLAALPAPDVGSRPALPGGEVRRTAAGATPSCTSSSTRASSAGADGRAGRERPAQVWDARSGTIEEIEGRGGAGGHGARDARPRHVRLALRGRRRMRSCRGHRRGPARRPAAADAVPDRRLDRAQRPGATAATASGVGASRSPPTSIRAINVVNRAIGGRSSRTFQTEGRWDRVLAELKPGDFVIMQFGHNDGGDLFKGNRPRGPR